MKRNKSGVSLIVLVITIIVMIILAAAVMISLSNTGILNKANEAVDATNLKTVQQIASIAWSEAYIDSLTDPDVNIADRVWAALKKHGITEDDYYLDFTDNGVTVSKTQTLGALITDPTVDYGKYVDYNAGGVTRWQVYYEDEENGYVFLIAEENVGYVSPDVDLSYVDITTDMNNLYSIFKLGQEGFALDIEVVGLVAHYSSYADTTESYKDYVVGAMGGPTIELLAAGYNAKYNTTAITPVIDKSAIDEDGVDAGPYSGEHGYFINSSGTTSLTGLTENQMYLGEYWLLSKSAGAYSDSSGYFGAYILVCTNEGISGKFVGDRIWCSPSSLFKKRYSSGA